MPRWDDTSNQLPLDTAELALDGGEARLPWLESPEDDEDEESPGAIRLIVFAGIGLLIVAVLAGTAWWLLRGRHQAPLPEGSTIRAPAQPYKVRPADPGGRDMTGTGDTAYAVSAGQVRPPRLATAEDAAPTPSAPASAVPTATASAKPSPDASLSAAPAATGPGVQVGAYSSAAAAEAGWQRLVSQHDVLSGHSHRVVRASADIGTVWRLQAVTANTAAAQALFSQLKSAGVSCQVK
jgi:hypothetical protein